MHMPSRLMLLGTALAASLSWTSASYAQNPADTKPEAARGQAAPQAKPAAEPAARSSEAHAATRPEPAATASGDRASALREMANDETHHRERLAKIARLRALAEAKGQTERLATLSDLERKETTAYETRHARHRQRVGDEAFRKADERFDAGRRRRRIAAGQDDKAEREKERKPAPAEAEKPERGAAAGTTPTRPASNPPATNPPADRPKADAGQSSASGTTTTPRSDKPRSQS